MQCHQQKKKMDLSIVKRDELCQGYQGPIIKGTVDLGQQ